MGFAALQLITCFVFLIGVVKIRIILGKYGLADRVNYCMFFVNALAFFF
jgi:hypothetical protein